MDLITDSYSGEFIAALIAIASASYIWLRKSITNFIDKVDKMDKHLTEIDKKLAINEAEDKVTREQVSRLIEDKLRAYYEDKKGI